MTDLKAVQHRLVSELVSVWSALLLLSLGTVFRLHLLGAKSLWPDEAFSVAVTRLSWPAFLRTVWWGEANMTLYYVFLRAWVRLGETEFCLRSLSVLFGVLTITATYAFGKRFFSREVGFTAALLLTMHSYHIRYSQELRSYTLVTLLVVLSTYAFLVAIEKPTEKSYWALYVVLSTLAIYAQVLAVFVLCSQWLLFTPSRIKCVGILRVLSVVMANAILVAPIAAVMLFQNKGQLDWVPPPTPVRVVDLFKDLVGSEALNSNHPIASGFLLMFYAAAWITAFSTYRARSFKAPGMNTALPAVGWWLFFPIVAMTGLSLLKPIMYPRYLVMCVPAAVLLAAYGLTNVGLCMPRGRIVSLAVLIIMLTLAVFSTRDYFIGFKSYGHNWRSVTMYILSRQQPQDAAIFYTLSGHRVFDYYLDRDRESGVYQASPAVLFPINLDSPSIVERTAPYRRVWLVLHQTIPTPETNRQAELIRHALQARFRLVSEREFPGAGVTRDETGAIRVALYATTASEEP